MLVDMGHSYLDVQITTFGKNKLTVLSSVTDPLAGAREFDYCLTRHFAQEIKVPLCRDLLLKPRIVANKINVLFSLFFAAKICSRCDEQQAVANKTHPCSREDEISA